MYSANTISASYQYQQNMFSSGRNNRFNSPITDSLTGYGDIVDTVELSPESLNAYSSNFLFDQLMGISSETINGKYKTLDQVGIDLQNNLSAFEDLAGSLFSMAGVDLSSPVTLQGDGLGNLVQVGEHKDSGKVDQTLSDNPVLTPRFMIIAARSAIMHAAETDPQFVTDYNSNPPETMEKYEDILKEYMLGFQMSISNTGIETKIAEPIHPQS